MKQYLSDRRAGSSTSSYRKDDYNWRYDGDELSEDVNHASAALENLQLDRKTRNLTSSWRLISLSLSPVYLWFSHLVEIQNRYWVTGE